MIRVADCRWTKCALALSLVALSGCAHGRGSRDDLEAARHVDEDLYAAAVRGTIAHFGGADDDQVLYCLLVPSERILAYFEKDPFVVAGRDACEWSERGVVPASKLLEVVEGGARVGTRRAPPRAMFLTVGGASYETPDLAHVEADITYGSLGANGVSITLERKNGQWRVVAVEDTWIS